MTSFRPQRNFALSAAQRADASTAIASLPEGMTLTDAVKLAKHTAGVAIERKTVGQVYTLFIDSRRAGELRGASLSWYESKLGAIKERFGNEAMDDVTRARLESFVNSLALPNGKPVSSSTKAAHYRAARAMWRWAKAQDPALVGRDITEGITVTAPKRDSDGAEFLTVPVVEQIMRNLAPKHQPAAALLFFAGIRPQEVWGNDKPPMLWRHIDANARTVCVESAIAKTRSRRVLQGLPDALWSWLAAAPKHKADDPIARCTAQQLIRAIQQAGGFWKFIDKGRGRQRKTLKDWPHDVTRHTFASYYIGAFDDPGKCALLMGHGGNPRMLYTHYLGLASRAEALKYWQIAPASA